MAEQDRPDIRSFTPPVRRTRDEKLQSAHNQAAWDKNVGQQTEEANAELYDRMNFAQAVVNNEFWTEDIPRSANTTVRNLWANIVGMPSDMLGLLGSVPLGGPGVLPSNAVVSSQDLEKGMETGKFNMDTLTAIPGNSTQLATAFGGDPDHLSMIATGVVSPGPGELATVSKATMLGLIGARRGGAGLSRLDDFLKNADNLPNYDPDLWQQTGWYKGQDGKPRFMLSDAGSSISENAYKTHPELRAAKKRAAESNRPEYTIVEMTMGEAMDHPELYKAYPELAGLKVTSAVTVSPGGAARFYNPLVSRGNKGALHSNNTLIDSISTQNLHGFEDLHQTLLHEAQHAVQAIEGFAQGGNSRLTGEMIDAYQGTAKLNMMLNFIDEGVETTDDLYHKLVSSGFTESQADKAVSDKITQIYLGADDLGRNEVRWMAEAKQAAAKNEIGHVLDYLFRGDTPEMGMDMLNQMDEMLEFEDIQELGYNAYRNRYGEAEARLTEKLRDLTQEQISNLKTAPNPADLADVTRPLSTAGEKSQAGQVTIRQMEQ